MAPRYWELPKPDQLYNKSELQNFLRESERAQRTPSLFKGLRGHQLAEIVKRMQKGLRLHLQGEFSYDELYAEYHDLGGVLSRKPTKQELIDVLDHAESQRTFEQFAELPPELRQRIYTFAFSYSDSAHHVQQPAISRVSRLLRTESLPVWYETNRFGLTISRNGAGWGVTGTRHLLTESWHYYVASEHIAMMRRFEVVMLTDKARVRVKINLPTPRGDPLEIAVWSITPEKYMTTQGLRQCQQAVEQQMRPVLDELLRHPGIGNFTTREIGQLALSAPRIIEVGGSKPNERLQL